MGQQVHEWQEYTVRSKLINMPLVCSAVNGYLDTQTLESKEAGHHVSYIAPLLATEMHSLHSGRPS